MLNLALRSLVLVMAIGPILGLGLGALTRQGEGGPGFSAFGAGLVLTDPYVQTSIGNSVVVSGIATLLASMAGVAVARASQRLGGAARRLAGVFERLGMCCDPFTAAIGLALIAPLVPSDLIARLPRDDSMSWFLLIACQAGFGSAWIAHHAGRAMAAIPNACLEVGAMAGGSRRWLWRVATWPLIRPTVARASASVFAVVLLEPGGPIVLGLRRTIGFQIVHAVFDNGLEDWTRPSVLAAVGLSCSILVRLALIRSAGRDELTALLGEAAPRVGRPDRMGVGVGGRLVDAASLLLILLWGALVLAPFWGLSIGLGSVSGGIVALELRSLRPFFESTITLAVLCLPVIFVAGLGRPGPRPRRLDGLLDAVPPLAVGVGLLAIAGLLRGWSAGASGGVGGGSEGLAAWLDPYRTPAVVACWAASSAMLPWLLNGRRVERGVRAREAAELARMVGDRRVLGRLTSRLVRGKGALLVGSIILAMQGALGLAPGIVAAPLESCRPLGPWILMAWDAGGPSGAAIPLAIARLAIGFALVVVATAPRRGIAPTLLVRG